MENKKQEQFNIKTLSPVHIGDGNKITKLDYLLEGKSLTVLSFDELISLLNENEINELTKSIERNENLDFSIIRKYLSKIKRYTVNSYINNLNLNKEIHQFIKTSDYKPYIPGSEIKGAIRTSILYKILKDNWDILKDTITDENKKNEITYLKNNAANHLENKVFGNIKNDVMKFFLVEDTQTIDSVNLTVEEIKIFNSRKRFTEYAECLKENTLVKNIKIKIERINPKMENPVFKNYPYKDYLLNWKNCAYEYSKDLIIVEKDYWRDRNQNIYSFLEKLEKENSSETPLLRIGRFTGKLSHTIVILLKIKELNKELKADRRIFPKTRRLTSDNKLLGWIKFTENNTEDSKPTMTKEEIKKN
ncbi:CRISPR type III-A/MTUBE-associated RAMP protein Csm5 [Persephonella hydrogeniphila]|uniref:CRISPR system Cms protein Csm5 n=1 Tax=Persephonella hydrogeniphila TaxID=198703 RepID=A0A285NM70_9AQUI|nr:type III-A CRISPR-associated RAMP protein Csm5 [Persephonella hydrogeniphila]SNZ10634.1 CRISPR type III-A/MTUBE-associated RAMP protein Csm5 [Persephonella hydrogeniphila]